MFCLSDGLSHQYFLIGVDVDKSEFALFESTDIRIGLGVITSSFRAGGGIPSGTPSGDDECDGIDETGEVVETGADAGGHHCHNRCGVNGSGKSGGMESG